LAAQAPDGGWTIGYGHTRTARAGAEVSERDAEALLLYDLIGVAHGVNEAVYTPLTQNQFDALCAFTFNVGLEAFRHSTVLRRINEGSLLQAASAMELWRKADFDGEPILVDALVRRRSAERALFLTPAGGAWVAAPSSVLRPRLDLDVDGLVPREAPVVVTTSFHGDRVTLVREAAPVRVIRPVEDAGPNPMQKAAESVTSRLQNFFRAPERRPAAKRPPEARAGLIVAVGVAGLILFLLGLYGLFNAGGPAANPVSRLGVTLAAGAGIVAMSVAAYLGFERFGRTFGDLGDE
jgi:lysozyme